MSFTAPKIDFPISMTAGIYNKEYILATEKDYTIVYHFSIEYPKQEQVSVSTEDVDLSSELIEIVQKNDGDAVVNFAVQTTHDGKVIVEGDVVSMGAKVISIGTKKVNYIFGKQSFYGKVLLPDNRPIPGATVKIFSNNDEEFDKTITDEDGFYKVDNLSPATYVIKVSKKGFSYEIKRNRLESYNPTEVNFILKQK